MDTHSRTVFITGCSSGIGRSTAIHFARLDWHVIATVRHQDDADKLMMLGYTNIQAELLDVDDETQIKALIKKIANQNKGAGLDALINNAGIANPYPLEYAATEHFHQHLSTNVIAPMVIINACLPLLKKNNGVIINVGSSISHFATPFLGAYSASKAAINALSDVLRIELSHSNIRVIVVEPGTVDTPMQDKICEDQAEMAQKLNSDGLLHYQPFIDRNLNLQKSLKNNAIKPSRVAHLICKLVEIDSPKSHYRIGIDARLAGWIEPITPAPIKDRLWKTVLGL